MAQDYDDAHAWLKAIELTECIHKLTQSFFEHEVHGLTSQMRRASVSVLSYLAEGRGRLTSCEIHKLLRLAQDSTYELQNHLLVAKRLGLGCKEAFEEAEALGNEIITQLGSLIQTVSGGVSSRELAVKS